MPKRTSSQDDHSIATAYAAGSSLPELLDAFEQAAYLVSPQGVLVFANAAAKRTSARAPAWVRPFAAMQPDDGAPPGARRVKLTRGTTTLWLVTAARQRPLAAALDWSRYRLSPSLAEIASLVAQGLKDKDIVEITGRPLATVRAYVARVYKRVGVTSRVELALLAKQLDPQAADR